MYIVGINRPYYPRIQEAETMDEAKAIYDRMKTECVDEDLDGKRTVTMYIAQVIKQEEFKTDY